MNEKFQIPIGEMPAEFLESNIPSVTQFCVSILHNSALAGSGTLVQCGEKSGIVTAHHVVHKGKRPFDFVYGADDAIGLLIMDKPHEFVLPLKHILCHWHSNWGRAAVTGQYDSDWLRKRGQFWGYNDVFGGKKKLIEITRA